MTIVIKKALLLSVVFLTSIQAHSQFQSAKYSIPNDDKVITQIGQTENMALPKNFNIFIWNVLKGKNKEDWAKDFAFYSNQSEVVFVQEGMLDDYMPNVLQRFNNWVWFFACSFIYDQNNFQSGVITGAQAQPVQSTFLRSPGREPVINTPKMIGLNYFKVKNAELHLLTMNIHGINFTKDSDFVDQINQAASVIEKHQGPIIFAGDFNTWNGNRLSYLRNKLKNYGFIWSEFKNDSRKLKLDHLFVKGIKIHKALILEQIKTSDHYPIFAELEVL